MKEVGRGGGALPIALRILAALILAGAFLPGPTFWGVNHLAYLPTAVKVAVAVLAVLAIIPIGAEGAWGFAERIVRSWPWTLAAGVLLAGLWTLLRERSFFLGDGLLLLEFTGREGVTRLSNAATFPLHGLLVKLAGGPSPGTALMVYRISSVTAGLAAFFGSVALTKRLDWDDGRRLLFLFLLLTSGAAVLFCGYVESYPWLFAFLTLFAISGALRAQGRIALWAPTAFLVLAIASHLAGLLAVPGYVALLGQGSRRSRAFWTVTIALAVAGAAAYALFAGSIDADLAPQALLRRPKGPFGVFSLATLRDVPSLLLLLAPVPLVIVAVRAASGGDHRRNPAVRFLAINILAAGLAILLMDPKLGAARDWDLFAPQVGSLVLLAVILMPGGKRPAMMAAATALVCVLPWALLQANEPAVVKRFAQVAAGFPGYQRAYAYEGLGKHYRERGDLE